MSSFKGEVAACCRDWKEPSLSCLIMPEPMLQLTLALKALSMIARSELPTCTHPDMPTGNSPKSTVVALSMIAMSELQP